MCDHVCVCMSIHIYLYIYIYTPYIHTWTLITPKPQPQRVFKCVAPKHPLETLPKEPKQSNPAFSKSLSEASGPVATARLFRRHS